MSIIVTYFLDGCEYTSRFSVFTQHFSPPHKKKDDDTIKKIFQTSVHVCASAFFSQGFFQAFRYRFAGFSTPLALQEWHCTCLTFSLSHSLSVCLTDGVCAEVRRPSRFLVLINPQSGKGQALALFNTHVQHMLQEADVTYKLQITGENTNWGGVNILRRDLISVVTYCMFTRGC